MSNSGFSLGSNRHLCLLYLFGLWVVVHAASEVVVCNILDYGAVGDGVTLNTESFTAAVQACCCTANETAPTVYVPSGTFLTGSFVLGSNMILNVSSSGTILGSVNQSDYPLVEPLPSYGIGRDVPTDLRYRSLIFAEKVEKISFVGGGIIDGNGGLWWKKHFLKELEYSRPPLIEIMNSRELYMSNITLQNSAFWTFHPYSSQNIQVTDSNFLAPSYSPNTDGIDIDSCKDVLVERCFFSVGDDGIAIKSGLNEAGRDYGVPSENILIRDISVVPDFDNLSTNGVSIGSEMSGGVRNVTVKSSHFKNCESGIYIKSMEGRGGVVENIEFSDISISHTLQAIRLSMNYMYRRKLSLTQENTASESKRDASRAIDEEDNDEDDLSDIPVFRDITLRNIQGDQCLEAGFFYGLQNSIIQDVHLINVNISSKVGFNCRFVEGHGANVNPPIHACFHHNRGGEDDEEKDDQEVKEEKEDIYELLGDITTAIDYRYDLRDSTGSGMDCLHVDYLYGDKTPWQNDLYFGLYHTYIDGEYEIRVASSSNLMDWTFRRTLIKNADMPFIKRLDDGKDGWIILAHEQWMNAQSQLPSQLGFKLFYNETQLLYGDYFNSYVAPLSVGSQSQLEGTPSIYDMEVHTSNDLLVVDADVGFHFNDDNGVDQVAYGKLQDFGPTTITTSFVDQEVAINYNELFVNEGAIGNIGQRAPGYINGVHLNVQEANIGPMPPTVWEDWRVWLYFYGPDESAIPTGAEGSSVEVLKVVTHDGSTAFANPSFTQLPCPPNKQTGACIFISYFIFSEGAAPGEQGVVSFFKSN